MLTAPIEPVFFHSSDSEIEVTRMSFSNLEQYLREVLERVRDGEALSYEQEEALKDVRRVLVEKLSDQPQLLAKLLAVIDEIILSNDDIIYPDDGEPRTDEDH